MKNNRLVEKLRYFNETVEQLRSFSFWADFPKDSGINIKWDKKTGITAVYRGPNDESLSAFILKYRLFIQDKDDISIKQMEKLYSTIGNDTFYNKFKELKASINIILDKPSMVKINQHTVTMREIHNVFLKGGWAHIQENNRERKFYLSIRDDPAAYTIFKNDFNMTLLEVMNVLVRIKFLNEELLKTLI
jgi:hypothetical protein